MKKQHFLILLFAFSVLFFVYGTFTTRETMKWCAIGLTVVTIVSLTLGTTKSDFLSDKTQATNAALAASNSFVFLIILLGFVFLWNIFVNSIVNMDFAVFGSMFLSVVLMRIFILQMVSSYIGKKV